jgi:signal transduction histidine kinase/CheY-like chemotaxis protein
MGNERPSDQQRVLLLAPSGRDGSLAARILDQARLRPLVCADGGEFCKELQRDVGASVIVEEALSPELVECIAGVLARQPPWSDLPFIIFARRHASVYQIRNVQDVLAKLGNVTVLERPIHSATLVSAVRAALRARTRQHAARASYEEREREVRQRDQFLALLGHELRNPLGAIATAVAIADLHAEERPALAHPLQVIDRQVRHLTQLVDELLDVARVTTGKITLRPAPLDLRSIAEAQTEEIRSLAREHHVDVELAQPTNPVLVMGDAVRLAQVVSNLLTNAVKYTPPGGHIDIAVVHDGDAIVRVKDTGVGISDDMLPAIFDPFTQVERTLDRSQGGMGLGLSVVRELVKLHGGNVSATSGGLGHGTEFLVRLPLLSEKELVAPAGRRKHVPAVAPPASCSRNILVIEDGADNRELLTAFLIAKGHQVHAASDGEEGIEVALREKPEVALVDIGLPRVDGYEVARRLRSTLGQGIYLIALTGYGQPDDRARATAAGFDVHMTKPMNLDRLTEMLSGRQLTALSAV